MITETHDFIVSSIAENEPFVKADSETQERGIREAETQIKMHYGDITIPVEALAYQTLWILSSDDTTRKAQQGVSQFSVNGLSVSLRSARPVLSPMVLRILGRKKGVYRL